eukprot:s3709_g9.t1
MVLYTSAESARNTAFPENGKSGWGLLPAPGGPLGQLLACTSQELQRELAGKQSAKVLVLGGNGVSAVSALRAGAARVVLWEPLPDVAAVAKEVVRRNLPEQVARCEISSEAIPSGPWDLVVVDRWHGSGLFSWGPAQCVHDHSFAIDTLRYDRPPGVHLCIYNNAETFGSFMESFTVCNAQKTHRPAWYGNFSLLVQLIAKMMDTCTPATYDAMKWKSLGRLKYVQ